MVGCIDGGLIEGGYDVHAYLASSLSPRLAALAATRYAAAMNFDHLLVRFFGTADIDTLSSDRLGEGVELVRLQLGLERDSGRRFALWCLLYMLGVAPDLDVAFKEEADREAARNFMDEADRLIEEDTERFADPRYRPDTRCFAMNSNLISSPWRSRPPLF